jgi:hypothetical protein
MGSSVELRELLLADELFEGRQTGLHQIAPLRHLTVGSEMINQTGQQLREDLLRVIGRDPDCLSELRDPLRSKHARQLIDGDLLVVSTSDWPRSDCWEPENACFAASRA